MTGIRPSLSLFLTPGRPCAYLPGQEECVVFTDPRVPMTAGLYGSLLARGFRRAGRFVYRPACDHCRACVPLRLPVGRFAPNRAQRRNLARNADLRLSEHPALFVEEHFALYVAYLRHRHPGGGMAEQLSPESYCDYLIQPWGGETQLLELRLGDRLVALAVTDRLPRALSAVYSFFDPELQGRGLGVQAILRQIGLAQELGLDHLYLGYWIGDCRKMAYKEQYRPLQALVGPVWREYPRGQALSLGATATGMAPDWRYPKRPSPSSILSPGGPG